MSFEAIFSCLTIFNCSGIFCLHMILTFACYGKSKWRIWWTAQGSSKKQGWPLLFGNGEEIHAFHPLPQIVLP